MKTCRVCGKELPSRRQLYCGDECAKVGALRRSRERGRNGKPRHGWEKRLIVCADCGKPIMAYLKSFRCAECQRDADLAHDREYRQRAKAGHARKIGGTYTCERCGEPYVLRGGKQRYCARCADLAAVERSRADALRYAREHPRTEEKKAARHKASFERVCAGCGKTFITNNSRKMTCGDKCSRRAWVLRKREEKKHEEGNQR